MLNKEKPRGVGGSTGSKSLRRADVRQKEDSFSPAAGQVCICASCRYFKLVPVPSGRIRHLCRFTGEKLSAGGNPLCEFRQEGGEA